MKALVLGASGQMGRAVAAALAAAGWQVDAATGGGRPLPEGLAGVRRIDAGPLPAMLGGGADLVFDPFCMTAADAAARLTCRADIGRLVVVSTASVYADAAGRSLESAGETGYPQFAGPVDEGQATVPPGDGYSAGKVAMERAFRDSGAPVTLLRPGAIHGPGARHPREWVVVKRLLDGRDRIAVVDRGENRFATTAAQNVAPAVLAAQAAGLDGPLNVADPDRPNVAQIILHIAAAMGREVAVVPVADDSGAGGTPWSVGHPFLLDTGRLDRAGWRPLSYAQALPPYLDWMLARAGDWQAAFPTFAHYPSDPFDYATEDAALAGAVP